MSRLSRGLVWQGLATLAGLAILVTLGLWQLDRLAWKEKLLAQIALRASAAPIPAPGKAEWPALKAEDYEFRHVTARGRFDHTREALVFAGSISLDKGPAQPGYWVVTPLLLEGGGTILVNRGFTPLERKEQAKRPDGLTSGDVAVTGLMRAPEKRNSFTPADRPQEGQWYTRDPASLATGLGIADAAPFLIDADRGAAGVWPRGGETLIALPNNHLSYALTWFGLAATLAGVSAAFAWTRIRAARTEAPA